MDLNIAGNPTIVDFSIDYFGQNGWKNFANILHREYSRGPLKLSYVCPHCKGDDFSRQWGVYPKPGPCPDCNGPLVAYWSEARTRSYFLGQKGFCGVMALKGDIILGWILGFDRSYVSASHSPEFQIGSDEHCFYIDMMVILPQFRKDRLILTGFARPIFHQPLAGLLYTGLMKKLRRMGYGYVFAKTLDSMVIVNRLLGMAGFKSFMPDPEDLGGSNIWVRKIQKDVIIAMEPTRPKWHEY